jgi:hypothetical protein
MRAGLGQQALSIAAMRPALAICMLLAGMAPTGALADTTFIPGAGVATVQAKCTACHPSTMITTRRFTAQGWAQVVDQMIDKGAQVSEADYAVIVTYLAKAYGAGR